MEEIKPAQAARWPYIPECRLETGKLTEAELQASIDRHFLAPRRPHLALVTAPACASDACRQGRTVCPTPEACQVGTADDFGLPMTPAEALEFWAWVWAVPAILAVVGFFCLLLGAMP